MGISIEAWSVALSEGRMVTGWRVVTAGTAQAGRAASSAARRMPVRRLGGFVHRFGLSRNGESLFSPLFTSRFLTLSDVNCLNPI